VPDGDHKRQDEGTPLSSARARVRISDPGGTNGACEPRSSPLNRGRRLAVSQVVKRGRSGWSSGHSSRPARSRSPPLISGRISSVRGPIGAAGDRRACGRSGIRNAVARRRAGAGRTIAAPAAQLGSRCRRPRGRAFMVWCRAVRRRARLRAHPRLPPQAPEPACLVLMLFEAFLFGKGIGQL